MSVNYTRINWEDSPSTQTPLNAENLNAMDSAIDDLAGAVNELDGVADDVEELQTDVAGLKNDFTQLEDKVEDAYNAYVVETETGAIASFTDGADDVPVKDLTVAIEPAQDLHGQSAPYPAGGGKNLTDYDTDFTSQVGDIENSPSFSFDLTAGKTYTVSCKQSVAVPTSMRNTLEIRPLNGIAIYESTAENFNPTNLRHTLTYTPQTTGKYEAYFWAHTPSVSATYNEWQVEESGSFTSYAPYSNICPISGWTGANVTRTGKNLYDISKQVVATYNTFLVLNLAHNTDYVFSTDKTIVGLYASYSDAEICPDVEGTWTDISSLYNITSLSFNSGAHKWYRLMTFEQEGVQERTYQLELGSTATAYEPYQGETYEVDWTTEAGTVYGGTLDVSTGVLTVDRKMYAISDGSTSTEVPGLFTRLTFEIPTDSITWTDEGSRSNKLICNEFEESYNDATYNGSIGIHYRANGSHQIMVGFGDIAHSWTEASAWVTAHPIVIVYALAVPVTYQLTPQEVKTVLGQNNIFADTGDTTVQYRADTKLYIDKVLSA